ncbi:DNA replication protein [Cryomyces antarcticus]|nr:DNA replication protein [Cryomyces antarcticus]
MSSYYDVDAILTDSHKLPCKFMLTVPGLGYIDGNVGEDMKQGTQVELPLWLGEVMAVSAVGTQLIELDLPDALSTRIMNVLQADAKTVDIRALAPHFYTLAARILELFDEKGMVEILDEVVKVPHHEARGTWADVELWGQAFKKRAAEIADQAHNPRGALGEGAEFLRGLDETERQLFRVAHDSAKAVRMWMTELKKA